MKIVIDTNRIIAALIRFGTSRNIIFNRDFKFITPDHSLSEIYKYERIITKKANITHDEFEVLLLLIFERIEIIPRQEYEKFLEECNGLISDIDDVPFLAVAIATKASGIWSDDAHFQEQDKVKVFSTEDMAKIA